MILLIFTQAVSHFRNPGVNTLQVVRYFLITSSQQGLNTLILLHHILQKKKLLPSNYYVAIKLGPKHMLHNVTLSLNRITAEHGTVQCFDHQKKAKKYPTITETSEIWQKSFSQMILYFTVFSENKLTVITCNNQSTGFENTFNTWVANYAFTQHLCVLLIQATL